MNKLIKVFLVPFIKLWFVYMAAHILVALSVKAYGFKLMLESSEILSFCFYAFLLVSPIYLNVKTNTFVKNISWMINSARNRTQLVTYYHLELVLRILLTLAPIALYYYLAKGNNPNKVYGADLFSGNYLLMILGTWALANFFGLSMSSLKKTSQTRISTKKSTKKSVLMIFALLFGIYIGGVIVESPVASEGLLVILSFLFLVYVYSTHFVLFRKKTRNRIFAIGAVILFIPSAVTVLNLIDKVDSSNTTFTEYSELGSLVNFIDLKNRNDIFQTLEAKNDIYNFLIITEDKKDIDIVAKINPKYDVSINSTMIHSIQNRFSNEELEALVQKIESFQEKSIDKFISKRSLRSVLKRANIENREMFVDNMANSDSKFRQAVALELVSLKGSAKELSEYKQNHTFILSSDQIESIR